MEISRLTLQVLSGLLALIPIAIGLKALSVDRVLAGVLVIFLSIGILTDVSMGVLVNSGNISLATKVFQLYSLFEALIFLWCTHRLTDVQQQKKAARYVACFIPFFWASCMFVLPFILKGFNYGSAIFDSTYEIILAFLTGFAILHYTEKNDRLLDLPQFWILFGIFFYCFGTFFIMIFVKTFLSQRIWFINNVVNVLTYGIYAVGLYRLSLANRQTRQ
jgi:hypothetical protein